MFLIPVCAAFSQIRVDQQAKSLLFGFFGILVVSIIGFRHDVGGDWESYYRVYNEMYKLNPYDIFGIRDPGYKLINWISFNLNLGIYGVNLISATIFTYGLIKFCKSQPYPWLTLSISMPYLVIVVGMGYTRQAIAMGIIFLAIPILLKGGHYKYILLVFLATMFHKSAVLMIPFVFVFRRSFKTWQKIIFALVFLATLWIFMPTIQAYYKYYVDSTMHSRGGRIRVWMNFLPVLVYLICSKKRLLFKNEGIIWKWISIAIIISVPLVEFFSSATDRMNLYFSVIQLVIWPRIILMQSTPFRKAVVAVSIVSLYSTALFVWLYFAKHSHSWVPYSTILL